MMNFSNEGYDGSKFGDFYIAKSSQIGPGWFIFGRNKHKYGVKSDGKGVYTCLCGYRTEKKAKNYNGRVRHGWHTKREAQEMLDKHLASYPHLNGEGQ